MKLVVEFGVEIKSDTKWRYAPTARPNRGLHDWERTIIFSRKLNDYEKKKLETLICDHDNPGYCGWSATFSPDNQMCVFKTTLDSSD